MTPNGRLGTLPCLPLIATADNKSVGGTRPSAFPLALCKLFSSRDPRRPETLGGEGGGERNLILSPIKAIEV